MLSSFSIHSEENIPQSVSKPAQEKKQRRALGDISLNAANLATPSGKLASNKVITTASKPQTGKIKI